MLINFFLLTQVSEFQDGIYGKNCSQELDEYMGSNPASASFIDQTLTFVSYILVALLSH